MAAALLTFRGRKDEALQELRKLLKVDPKNHDAALTAAQFLSQAGKYSEAAELLEVAVKSSPDSPSLQLALGTAYLKSGAADTALPHLRKAIEAEDASKGADADTLNNVAYDLAESKTNLDLAKNYAERAVAEVERQSVASAASEDTAARITNQLSYVWDTLGWVYFQMGDAARAESYVRASWVLGQEGIVGDHLGQIYEKLGKKSQAMHVYELALETSSTPVIRMGGPFASDNARRAQHEAILARYEKLAGKKPSTSTHRLPNGEWSLTPADELSRARKVDFKQVGISGDAVFLVVFAPGKVESARHITGEDSLKALTDKLTTAKFQVDFPTGSTARIVRRVTVSCHTPDGCAAVMLPTNSPATPIAPN